MSGPSFHLKLKQTQQLNQAMRQSLRILHMSGIELEREVDDWLQDNPLLERSEPAESFPREVPALANGESREDRADSPEWVFRL